MSSYQLRIILLIALLLFPAAASAQSLYAPSDLYDVETVRLGNGFQVLLKQRSETRSVAFRLVVGVGTRHFDCSRRETPHLLEHLLFSGTTRHSEAELEHLIADLGGSWNAVTGAEVTTYQLDIFDRYALQGLDLLHEIITDTVITAPKIDLAKRIVYREEGGKPGPIRRILYGAGLGKTAWKKANEWLLPGNGAVCSGLVNMEEIAEKDIANVIRTVYVPENMTLLVVGNFERKALLDRIRATFGGMTKKEKPKMTVVTPPVPSKGPAAVSNTLSTFFGNSGSFSAAFRTEGRAHPDAAALIVLSSYLNTKLYEQIRVKAGLSYAPETVMFFQPDYGVFYVTADVSVKDMRRLRELVIGILDRLRREKIAPDEVERTKRKIMLQWAQGYETNAGHASWYVERLSYGAHEGGLFRENRSGIFKRYEEEIGTVSARDLDRVVERYIRPDRRIEIRSTPTTSYSTFFSVIGGVVLSIALVVVYRVRRAGKQKRETLPLYIR